MAFISGILLAAGLSKRMGSQKLLLPFQGRPLLYHSIENILRSSVDEIIIVLQNGTETVRAADTFLAEWREKNKNVKKRTRIAENTRSAEGMSSSLSLGVSQAPPQSGGYLFILGDMPFITADIIDTAIRKFQARPDRIVICRYRDKEGHPVLFPASLRKALLDVTGDTGGKVVIRKNPEILEYIDFDGDLPLTDIDTLEDYRRFCGPGR